MAISNPHTVCTPWVQTSGHITAYTVIGTQGHMFQSHRYALDQELPVPSAHVILRSHGENTFDILTGQTASQARQTEKPGGRRGFKIPCYVTLGSY